jgi:hypothetical protein
MFAPKEGISLPHRLALLSFEAHRLSVSFLYFSLRFSESLVQSEPIVSFEQYSTPFFTFHCFISAIQRPWPIL